MAAPAQASIRVLKRFTFKGQTKDWSNRYFLNQTSIPDLTHFNTLSDAIVTAEKAIYGPEVTIINTFGYNGGSDLVAFSKAYTTLGTLVTTGARCPGEVASLVRYSTAFRTAKNHPYYLYNFYHGAWNGAGSAIDQPIPNLASALGTYANLWTGTGFSDGTTTYKRAGPSGHPATGSVIETYLTHRDFPK